MFFHFSELLNADQDIHLQDELEFTVVQVSSAAVDESVHEINLMDLSNF